MMGYPPDQSESRKSKMEMRASPLVEQSAERQEKRQRPKTQNLELVSSMLLPLLEASPQGLKPRQWRLVTARLKPCPSQTQL